MSLSNNPRQKYLRDNWLNIRGCTKENEVVGYAYLTIRLNETLSVVS